MDTLSSFIGLKPNRAAQAMCLPDASVSESTRKPAPAPDRSLRKRFLVMLALVAVPAMAAPGDFGALPGDASTATNTQLARHLAENPAMPFERPGMSFPGSAFFFLADPPSTSSLVALPTTDATAIGGESGRELGAFIDVGPLECLAQAVWYEAASESEAGQRAVAQVVLNRVSHPNWPGSVCGVVYQGSQRSTGCQFSFTCDGSLSRKARGATWQRARRIAGDALSGSVYQPIGHATHYHTLWVNPYWASSLDHIGTIGAHRFYRNSGAAGEKPAFSGGYAGYEPGVAVRTGRQAIKRSQTPKVPTARMDAGAPLSPPGIAPAVTGTRSGPLQPVIANPELSNTGQVRDDYARAGQWKSDAARAALQSDRAQIEQEQFVEGDTPSP